MSCDIRYYWLRDRENQLHFKISWKKGTDPDDPNNAYYHTKHHSIIYQKGIRHRYVHDKANLLVRKIHERCSKLDNMCTRLRGCIDLHSL